MYAINKPNNGYFVEKEFKCEFTYRKTQDSWAIEHGYEYEIDVGHYETRFANIKKTVAYVLCDNPSGTGDMVLEKWSIKNTGLN